MAVFLKILDIYFKSYFKFKYHLRTYSTKYDNFCSFLLRFDHFFCVSCCTSRSRCCRCMKPIYSSFRRCHPWCFGLFPSCFSYKSTLSGCELVGNPISSSHSMVATAHLVRTDLTLRSLSFGACGSTKQFYLPDNEHSHQDTPPCPLLPDAVSSLFAYLQAFCRSHHGGAAVRCASTWLGRALLGACVYCIDPSCTVCSYEQRQSVLQVSHCHLGEVGALGYQDSVCVWFCSFWYQRES